MSLEPKFLNPYIKFARSSKDVALYHRFEKRMFYDFGFIGYYIIAEIIEKDSFYGEQKLNYKSYYKTTFKIVSDTISDEQLNYAKLGLDWALQQKTLVMLNKELFTEHITDPLFKDTGIIRESPKPGDLIYFDQNPNDNENTFPINFPYLFRIQSVNIEGDNSSLHFARNINYKLAIEPHKQDEFNKIDPNLTKDLGIESNVNDVNKDFIPHVADNLKVQEDHATDIGIIKKKKNTEL